MNRMRVLLARYGVAAKKSWGQNFLVDEGVQDRIVAGAAVGPQDTVVEIGAGLGALTSKLAERAGRVIAVEREADMLAVLRAELGAHPNVQIWAGDAQDFDYAAAARTAGRPVVVVGNLPYQITSPLLFAALAAAERGAVIARAVVMVQKEFGDRMRSDPGSKIYGRLSVMVAQTADVELLFHVSPHAFLPQPRVTSSVLRVRPRDELRGTLVPGAPFADVVRLAFGMRRKMLRGALGSAYPDAQVLTALEVAGIDPTMRAERLPVEAFARIANALAALPRSDDGDAAAAVPEPA